VACIAVIYKNSKNILFKCTKLFYTLESDTDCFFFAGYEAEEEIFIKNMVYSTTKKTFDTNIELGTFAAGKKRFNMKRGKN